MRLLEVHTCPVWEDPDGHRRVGITFEADHPPVVGWCNVAFVEIAGTVEKLLLTVDAGD